MDSSAIQVTNAGVYELNCFHRDKLYSILTRAGYFLAGAVIMKIMDSLLQL
ncbi:MAG TPA: hypothetical protein H9717_03535 [Candidatus Eisenbergiella merdipullorum]|uniref:Uncharacterized protein n=1 Tax=Candidatus Eisenbergiella merdipullorum TaxID=2838553 RepID=A0A9D2I504_9FIRM|nr:hypothetical protein [Candidatus Eisenbergiella merdipullorum]